MTFMGAYATGQPVMVILPTGRPLFVVGVVWRQDGLSFADDAFIDAFGSGHFPLHHLTGEAVSEGDEVRIDGHSFRPCGDDVALVEMWNRMFEGGNVAKTQMLAERALRKELARM